MPKLFPSFVLLSLLIIGESKSVKDKEITSKNENTKQIKVFAKTWKSEINGRNTYNLADLSVIAPGLIVAFPASSKKLEFKQNRLLTSSKKLNDEDWSFEFMLPDEPYLQQMKPKTKDHKKLAKVEISIDDSGIQNKNVQPDKDFDKSKNKNNNNNFEENNHFDEKAKTQPANVEETCRKLKPGKETCEVRVWTDNLSDSSDVITFADLSVLVQGLVVGFPSLTSSQEKVIDIDLFSSRVKEKGKFTFANISFLLPNALIGIRSSRRNKPESRSQIQMPRHQNPEIDKLKQPEMKKLEVKEPNDLSQTDLSSLVQQTLGRERFGSQALGNSEDFGTSVHEGDLEAFLGPGYRGLNINSKEAKNKQILMFESQIGKGSELLTFANVSSVVPKIIIGIPTNKIKRFSTTKSENIKRSDAPAKNRAMTTKKREKDKQKTMSDPLKSSEIQTLTHDSSKEVDTFDKYGSSRHGSSEHDKNQRGSKHSERYKDKHYKEEKEDRKEEERYSSKERENTEDKKEKERNERRDSFKKEKDEHRDDKQRDEDKFSEKSKSNRGRHESIETERDKPVTMVIGERTTEDVKQLNKLAEEVLGRKRYPGPPLGKASDFSTRILDGDYDVKLKL